MRRRPRGLLQVSDVRDHLKQLAAMVNGLIEIGQELNNADADITIYSQSADIWFYGDNCAERVANVARAIRKQFTTEAASKNYDESTFRMEIEIQDSPFYFSLYTARNNVCKRIDTGKTETKVVRDYQAAPTTTKEVPVIEWECSPILDQR